MLLAWENEAILALKEFGAGKFEIVTPSVSILAEPPVALVDKFAERHGTSRCRPGLSRIILYSDEGQEIAAKNFYRPRNEAIAAKTRPSSCEDRSWSPWMRHSALGEGAGRILRMAEFLTKSINHKTRSWFLQRGGRLAMPAATLRKRRITAEIKYL